MGTVCTMPTQSKPSMNLRHEFVETIPARLEVGVIYVSISFATAAHLCCCGCGHEVITPLTPTDWRLTYDGETISLHPSIGNWSLVCRSHYWVKRGRVEWAADWSHEEVEAGRSYDRHRKTQQLPFPPPSNSTIPQPQQPPHERVSIWARVMRWF